MVALSENDLDPLTSKFRVRGLCAAEPRARRARSVEGRSRCGAAVRLPPGRDLLDAENLDTGGPLLRRPEESASLVVFVRPGNLTIGGVARYVGDRTDFGDVALAAYTTVDLSLALRLGERWEPFLRVENVLDEDYAEAAGFPAPGLGFRAGLDLRF